MTSTRADGIYRDVMTVEPPAVDTALAAATRDFVFGRVWSRQGLSRRDRRLVTLTCVAAADAPQPIDDHVYAALNSGDLTLLEVQELVLQFAVYCGWPKAAHLEGIVRRQWARLRQDRGADAEPWPLLDNATLGLNDWEERLARGAKEFADINLMPAPNPDSPYTHAGILSYVFGHVWQRPGMSRRDRRVITVACVAIDDSPMPLRSHVSSALESGDTSGCQTVKGEAMAVG